MWLHIHVLRFKLVALFLPSVWGTKSYGFQLIICQTLLVMWWIRVFAWSWYWGRFKKAYELICQCMGKIFCVEFQRETLKFYTKYLTHILKNMHFIHLLKFRSLYLRAHKGFWNARLTLRWLWQPRVRDSFHKQIPTKVWVCVNNHMCCFMRNMIIHPGVNSTIV